MTKDEQQNLKLNSQNDFFFLYYFDKRSYFTKNRIIKDNY